MTVIMLAYYITVGWKGRIKANNRLSSLGDGASNVYDSIASA